MNGNSGTGDAYDRAGYGWELPSLLDGPAVSASDTAVDLAQTIRGVWSLSHSVTVYDLSAVAAYLRILTENAYQLAVLAVNAVLVADPRYRTTAGPTGFTIFGSLVHAMKLATREPPVAALPAGPTGPT